MALERRFDIKVKSTALENAKVYVNSKRASYLPELSAFATYDWISPSTSSSGDKDSWKTGIQCTWSLFDGFARKRALSEAHALKRAAEYTYKDTKAALYVDIKERLYAIEEGILSYFAAKEGASLAEDAITEAKQKRDLGLISSFEYRDLAKDLTQAKQNFNQASFNLLMAYYSLRKSAALDS